VGVFCKWQTKELGPKCLVRVAAKGLKVMLVSASGRESAKVARKGAIGRVGGGLSWKRNGDRKKCLA
jgi:hypothetical protein